MSKNKQKKVVSNRKGFTLVELLIAMTIFLLFIGVVVGAYTGIIRAQRNANEYRIMYSEARSVFDSLTWELRNGIVDYGYYVESETEGYLVGALDELVLVPGNGDKRVLIGYENDAVYLMDIPFENAVFPEERRFLNNPEEVRISDFRMYVSPVFDPYDLDYTSHDFQQFHPKVTVYAFFEREFGNGSTYDMILQTTVSSRIYNQAY